MEEVVIKKETTLKHFIAYFLKLGATVFGGPLVPLTHIRKDLVDKREWVSKEEFGAGLSLAQLTPGPMTAQVIMFLGWLHGGVRGAALTGVAYILPAFLMILIAAEFYIRFAGLTWLHSISYGVSAAVVAILLQSAVHLWRRTLRKDVLLWFIAVLNAVLVVWLQAAIIVVFIFSGIFVLGMRSFLRKKTIIISFLPPFLWFFSGIQGQVSSESLGQMAWFFLKAGAIVFGGGLVILPYLQQGVVYHFHWLTESQFLDAVAIAMMTPGPILIAVAFMGYLIAGLGGAVIATTATLLPCYLLVITLAPYYQKSVQYPYVKDFIKGISAAAIGALVGSSLILAVSAFVDLSVVILSFLYLGALVFLRVPGVFLILLAGGVGFFLKM